MLNNVSFENLFSYLMVDAKILFVVICRFLVPQLNKKRSLWSSSDSNSTWSFRRLQLYQEERAREQEARAKQEAWGHLPLVLIILCYTFCIVIKHLELMYVLQTIIVYLYGRSLNWILVLFFTYGMYGSFFINVLLK